MIVALGGGIPYLHGCKWEDKNISGINIYSIKDPEHPELLSHWETGFEGGMGGFVTGNLPIYLRGGIPRYMAPGILLGSLATAALSMPGSPQIQDSGPIRYLETSSIAAPIPGFIGGAVVIVLNIAPGLA